MMKVCEKRIPVLGMTFILVMLVAPSAASAQMYSGNAFGQCAVQKNIEIKIAACTEASKLTPYPWVLTWVYRELVRAHRDHGETDTAITYYARSLAAKEDDVTRREMEILAPLSIAKTRRMDQAKR
jgi:hypothetical protein